MLIKSEFVNPSSYAWTLIHCENLEAHLQDETRRKRNRADTEQRLINVALESLRTNGVLAGLNLKEVAAGAGVNRGNIYHYFGSRRDLLRAAISQRFKLLVQKITAGEQNLGFVKRRLRTFLSVDDDTDSKLRALLVIDGDNKVDPAPHFEAGYRLLEQDVVNGDIHPDHDLAALLVALSAFSRGYRIFRRPFANRLNIPPAELDRRVAGTLHHWLQSMEQQPRSANTAAQSGPDAASP